jgi:trans-2,3-dihydro-3-hydroxyanthranilate isomerase
MGLLFYIVDVFAEEKYAGNQLAVFREAAHLSTEQMQRIAKEVNYSETTFVMSESMQNGTFPVRIFTPEQELPFAGHPTLGTAHILQSEIVQEQIESIALDLKVGRIPVTLSYVDQKLDVLWMRQNVPTFGRRVSRDAIAPVLNLQSDDISDAFPIEEVSTGVPFLIVPLNSLDALQRSKVNRDLFFELIESTEAKAILVFCAEPRSAENQLAVRVFADGLGIPEDPATGSANGCLAGYLVQHQYFGTAEIDIRVEQGYEMGRPSLLMLRAKQAEEIQVSVGGRVILVARGEFV